MDPVKPAPRLSRVSLINPSSSSPSFTSRSSITSLDASKQSPAAPAAITHPSLTSLPAKPSVHILPSVQSGDSVQQDKAKKSVPVTPQVIKFTPPRQPQIVRETSVAAHTDHHSLQETLRTLADEGTGNEVYWLPVAVARFGFKNANVRAAGLNIRASADADNPDDKLDPTKAILSRWSHAAKTEEKLYELQQKELRQQKASMFAMEEEGDAVDSKNAGLDANDDDEDLQELLDELRVSAPNPNFRRANERRSKRYTSQFEEEIAERNVHLRQRMEQMNSRVKKFEKGFEALDSLAVKMDTLAESSKRRVQFLEQCLVPLYNESSWHQICRNNAEKATIAIEAALNHYQVPEQLSAVIQAGPVKNLSAYCKALERVKSSLDFFSEYHLATPEFEHVSALYRTGRENLIKEFRDLLRMHSKAVPAVIIQDAIVNNLHDPSISHDFAHFAETVYNDLKMVTAWFVSTKDNFDFMDVYAKFRLDAMKDSLDQFRSFYKESADSSTLGVGEIDLDRKSMSRSMGFDGSSMHSSEIASQMGDDASSMAPVNGEDGGAKSYTLKRRSAIKSTPRKKNATRGTGTQGLFQKLRRIKTNNSAMKKTPGARVGIDEETYQKVETYMAMVSAFLKLLESEVGLMYGIIPDEHMRDVFDRIVLPAILRFESSGKELSDKILLHVNNGDFSAVLLLLQLLEHFEDLKPLFESALEGCTHETQHHWTRVEQTFRSAVLRTMDGFLANIKSSTDRVLPPDGTVHEVTSNTIAFLSNLVDYRVLFDSVITPDVTENQRKSLLHNFRAGHNHNTPTVGHNFPKYLNSVVSHLLASLTTRSENYNDPTLKAVFLLNNTAYMYNHLKQVGIINIMMEDNQDVDRLISGRISEQRRAYVDCWTVLTRLLTEAIGEAAFLRPRSPNDVSLKLSVAQQTNYDDKLKERDRQLIKDRCVAINKELTAQAVKQEKYSVPDHNLRTELKTQNRNDILHLYDTYRQRYTHIPFTKFYDKYLPFTTAQVSDMLDRFFSQDTFTSALNTPGQVVRIDD